MHRVDTTTTLQTRLTRPTYTLDFTLCFTYFTKGFLTCIVSMSSNKRRQIMHQGVNASIQGIKGAFKGWP